ncbi:MAG: TIGR00282 family metallophosphoesterase [Alphaproteobacteria bacterium]|nr:TIGR00282 family metallophosphoesterase [Alphaproteobacteria bacterium SS10]
MKIMFLGDVVGRSGRDAVLNAVPDLRARYGLDFVVVNGENAAHGFGITPDICSSLYNAEVDCITTGNHVWDQRQIINHIDGDERLLRPLNFPAGTPGRGFSIFKLSDGRQVMVINAIARLFMELNDSPFAALDRLLERYELGRNIDAVLLDFHGEATSEKMGMGHHLDGRVSLVVGTHTHVPTSDLFILPGGTAYQTDAGMCGDYDSVIGMRKSSSTARFTQRLPTERAEPATGEATICGLLLETDDATGLAKRVTPIRMGGQLQPAIPDDSWRATAAAPA